MQIGNKNFDLKKRTCICGILNMTPDSFSDGGKWNDIDRALSHTEEMIRGGADIIDVGGESTKPGYLPVSVGEEMSRVVPVIEQIKKHFDVPISIDTQKAEVAAEAVSAGASMLNDVSGIGYTKLKGSYPDDMHMPIVLTHNSESKYARLRDTDINDEKSFFEVYMADIRRMIDRAERIGIKREDIIIDPGIGFGKTYEENLCIINKLELLQSFGFPIYFGSSRKAVIKKTLEKEKYKTIDAGTDTGRKLLRSDKEYKLLNGTAVTSVYAVMNHASFIRVHDVPENYLAIRMAEAIRDSGRHTRAL